VHLWSARTETPIGEVIPASTLWTLSRSWFDGRLSPDWKARSIDQSQQLLTEAGLIGAFWTLAT
jgi:hypothetical protein